MKYVELGKSGPMVSTVGFGAWAIGGMNWGKTDDAVSKKALRTALECGVTLIDTADVYGFGHSEELIKDVINNQGIYLKNEIEKNKKIVEFISGKTKNRNKIMPLAKRIIPCLDVTEGRVVKGTRFIDLRDAGDAVELGAFYDDQGADELVFLDITASSDKRKRAFRICA